LLNRFSNSPDLELIINPSIIRRKLYGGLCVCTGLAIYLVYARGYTVFAAALSLPSVMLLWGLASERSGGAVLRWRSGQWFILDGKDWRKVQLLPGSVRLPWLLKMTLEESGSGRRWPLALFSDSIDSSRMWHLRRRLMLGQL
jgi:hypothetical protein